MFVCWYVGMLACWIVGMLAYWYVCMFVCLMDEIWYSFQANHRTSSLQTVNLTLAMCMNICAYKYIYIIHLHTTATCLQTKINLLLQHTCTDLQIGCIRKPTISLSQYWYQPIAAKLLGVHHISWDTIATTIAQPTQNSPSDCPKAWTFGQRAQPPPWRNGWDSGAFGSSTSGDWEHSLWTEDFPFPHLIAKDVIRNNNNNTDKSKFQCR